MHVAQLRQADLNLLVVFTVLAEERNVSRAAKRLSLSQPGLTRALQRLRHMFGDDLIVRVSGNYEPTPKGQQLLQELEEMLPRLDRLLAGAAFDPSCEEVRFRLAGTDYAAHVLGPALCRKFLAAGSKVSFDLSPVDESVFDAMERGRIDLLLYADDGRVPPNYPREAIFEDDLVCVVARDAYGSRRLTLEQYLRAPHVGVAIAGGAQTIPEKLLREAGRERRCTFRVPYFAMAVRSVAGTSLVATVPRRLAIDEARDRPLKILEAPKMFGSFEYLMAWHPRMNSDAAHGWLRAVVRETGNQMVAQKTGIDESTSPVTPSRFAAVPRR